MFTYEQISTATGTIRQSDTANSGKLVSENSFYAYFDQKTKKTKEKKKIKKKQKRMKPRQNRSRVFAKQSKTTAV